MQESKSCALPLGDSPINSKGWVKGLEPSASRATIWRASQLRHTHHTEQICHDSACHSSNTIASTKRVMGIEPTYLAWKASVLPLNYTRIYSVTCFACYLAHHPDFVRMMHRTCLKGFEPPTHGLEGRCSIQLSYKHTCLGVTGFEPAASWSQTRRSSQTEPHPVKDYLKS